MADAEHDGSRHADAAHDDAAHDDTAHDNAAHADTEHDVLRLTDPQAIRAYTHRTRMALVGLLRTEGPLTATRAAELTGESVASCSYHLRMLAKYGVVEEVPGPGRQKPWRATAQFTDVPRALDPAAAAAATDLRVFLAGQYFGQVVQALRNAGRLTPGWQDAEQFGDLLLYLTPVELKELYAAFEKLVQPFYERNTAPESRPEGAELVHLLQIAYRKDHAADGPAGPDAESGPDSADSGSTSTGRADKNKNKGGRGSSTTEAPA